MDTFANRFLCHQLIVRDSNDDIIGSSLVVLRKDKRAVLPLRRLFLNTAGEDDADNTVVEYNAVLCASEHAEAVHDAIAAYIGRSGADEFMLSGGTERAVALCRHVLPTWRADVEWRESPFVDLEALRAAGAGHLDVISRNTREQIRRSLRRYAERGELSVSLASTPLEMHQAFAEMVRLHEARWQAAGELGGFATPLRKQFHAAFVEHGGATGHMHLLRVYAGGQLLGVLYNLVANGHVCFYQSGLQYEADKQLKPGLVVHHLAIEHYLANGYREYDFLPSETGEGRYKQSLSTSSRRLGTLRLQRPGLRRRYFDAARRVKLLMNQRAAGARS
ncbi:GNAT family N-acetyltransferase [Gemmatimonas sp.]